MIITHWLLGEPSFSYMKLPYIAILLILKWTMESRRAYRGWALHISVSSKSSLWSTSLWRFAYRTKDGSVLFRPDEMLNVCTYLIVSDATSSTDMFVVQQGSCPMLNEEYVPIIWNRWNPYPRPLLIGVGDIKLNYRGIHFHNFCSWKYFYADWFQPNLIQDEYDRAAPKRYRCGWVGGNHAASLCQGNWPSHVISQMLSTRPNNSYKRLKKSLS